MSVILTETERRLEASEQAEGLSPLQRADLRLELAANLARRGGGL